MMHDAFWNNPFVGAGFGVPAMLGFGAAAFGILIVAVTLWTLIWKGLALWQAARNGQKWWFVALLIINTVGLLEIIYLFGFRADRKTRPLLSATTKTPSSPKTKDDSALPVAESSPAE